MKKLMLLSLASLAINVCAGGQKAAEKTTRSVEVKKELENAKVVRYSITIYRGDDYDKDAWQETVAQTAQVIELGSQDGNTGEFVESVIKSIQRMYTRSNINDGIHGEIKVGLGDGACNCAGNCTCAQQYKGLCPCSALNGSDCQKETLRSPAPTK